MDTAEGTPRSEKGGGAAPQQSKYLPVALGGPHTGEDEYFMRRSVILGEPMEEQGKGRGEEEGAAGRNH